ncbi:ABC-type spermidine/putrescine transport system, permease component I (plasmid) [Neorhizobium galegae bv. officinalis bv. officinalis str. HAMBI 1141]|uniref:ABC-type spermidine/putrescine transport system, permease component I n=1 Tax=Neorhizobium galegae bv. officinalis bv. officinalis str. HAMBI 1141 TaxID=1028801 RepID=A0A068TJH2_NEOGA|nr:ABC transporter permease [Neorhizobium galegae]CDN58463.1 ABC-type spermidine/putrescine transport system, permease component I [Neorhizobium galegae bv. officinalis bv. officinalis str. HAMBI 1141]
MTATASIDAPSTQRIKRRPRTGSARRYSKTLSLILIAPLVLLMGFGFLYPVGKLLLGSFFAPEFGLEQFRRLIRSPLYLTVLLRTFEIAFAVTIASLIIGYPIAFAMAKLPRRWAALTTVCVLIPLWTSTLVRSYAWIVLLQRKGVVNELLLDLGWITEPLRLIYTEGAVIMAMTHVLLPYTILPIFAAVRAVPNELGQAARNLGAGGLSVFWRVMLPLSLPGVFAGCLMTFILALGFYVTPALVGGPRTMLMATLIGQQTTETLDWAFAGALSTVLLAATLTFVVAFRKTLSLNRGFAGVS